MKKINSLLNIIQINKGERNEKTKDGETKEMKIVVLVIPSLTNQFCENENLC